MGWGFVAGNMIHRRAVRLGRESYCDATTPWNMIHRRAVRLGRESHCDATTPWNKNTSRSGMSRETGNGSSP